MSIRRSDNVVAGAAEILNTKPLQEFLDTAIGIFTEDTWETMTDMEKNQYKLALIYSEVTLP